MIWGADHSCVYHSWSARTEPDHSGWPPAYLEPFRLDGLHPARALPLAYLFRTCALYIVENVHIVQHVSDFNPVSQLYIYIYVFVHVFVFDNRFRRRQQYLTLLRHLADDLHWVVFVFVFVFVFDDTGTEWYPTLIGRLANDLHWVGGCLRDPAHQRPNLTLTLTLVFALYLHCTVLYLLNTI